MVVKKFFEMFRWFFFKLFELVKNINKNFFSLLKNILHKFKFPTKGVGFEYVKNTLFISISKAVESIISFLIIILISRELGAVGLGQCWFIFYF
jgi:hypothetical protein